MECEVGTELGEQNVTESVKSVESKTNDIESDELSRI